MKDANPLFTISKDSENEYIGNLHINHPKVTMLGCIELELMAVNNEPNVALLTLMPDCLDNHMESLVDLMETLEKDAQYYQELVIVLELLQEANMVGEFDIDLYLSEGDANLRLDIDISNLEPFKTELICM